MNLDPDGYTITVDDTIAESIGVNGSVMFAGLSPGEHLATLTGTTINSSLTSANPVRVTVPQGREVATTFVITCN